MTDHSDLIAVRCEGCGSAWTDADLARERAANPRLLSCCPERKPLTIDQWRARAEAQSLSLSEARAENDRKDLEIERLKPYRDELLKIAADVGEPDDPFAAWETIASLSPAATPVSEAGGEPDWNGIARRMQRAGAPGTEEELEAALRAALANAGGDVVEALNWTERQIRAAKQAMKESAALGNGYANFAAHDAHKHLTTIRAALSQSTSAGRVGE